MKLTDLWTAMVAGDHSALELAYLHRVMRERGGDMMKGREDVASDWAIIVANHPQCAVIVDLGDMAIIEIGDATYHHWVRREDGWIAFEVLILAKISGLSTDDCVIERQIKFDGKCAELFHLFRVDGNHAHLRCLGSRIVGTSLVAVGAQILNGQPNADIHPHRN